MKDDIVKMQDFVVRVVNNGGFVVARAKELYWPSEITAHSAFSTLAEVFAHIEDIYAREIIKIPKTQDAMQHLSAEMANFSEATNNLSKQTQEFQKWFDAKMAEVRAMPLPLTETEIRRQVFREKQKIRNRLRRKKPTVLKKQRKR